MLHTEVIDLVFDGTETTFDTSLGYKSGTLVVFVPTLLTPAEVIENGGTSFTLTFAPESGDMMMVFYQTQ